MPRYQEITVPSDISSVGEKVAPTISLFSVNLMPRYQEITVPSDISSVGEKVTPTISLFFCKLNAKVSRNNCAK